MAESTTTTTTTTEKPEDTTTTTTTTTVDESKKSVQGDAAGNSSDNTTGPSREESLREAGKASPHAPDAGIEDGTKVLGSEGQSSEDRLDESRREALANAEDEQKLSA